MTMSLAIAAIAAYLYGLSGYALAEAGQGVCRRRGYSMRPGQATGILLRISIVIIVLVTLIAVTAKPALAEDEEAAISISPSHGPVGTVVQVSISNFLSNTEVTITFVSQDTIVKVITTDANGAAETSFTVGSYYAGTYSVWADDGTNQGYALFALEMMPAISISPSHGPVGTVVQILINDFLSEPTEIAFIDEQSPIEIVTPDINGDYETSFTIGPVPAGRYRVWADDGTNKYWAFFTVESEIELDTTSDFVGAGVIIAGSGFASNSTLTTYFDGTEVSIGETNGNGTFTNLRFEIPESSKGNHTIEVHDDDGHYGTTQIATKQTATIAPILGVTGSDITISGTGFQADGDVIIYFDNEDRISVATDSKGSFTATLLVPELKNGTYLIKITDSQNRFYREFTINAGMATSPASGHIGSTITVQGTAFRVDTPVTITYDGTEIGKTTTNIEGAFVINVTVPASKAGEHEITASDGVNAISSTFNMESTPPLVPNLLLPVDATETADDGIYFDWGSLSDPSGVTYTLIVARDANFSDILMERSGLIYSEYTISEEELLLFTEETIDPEETLNLEEILSTAEGASGGKSIYYWRVRAVDGASNTSEWSPAGSFSVGHTFSFTLPEWARYSLIGLSALLLCVISFWLGNAIGPRRSPQR